MAIKQETVFFLALCIAFFVASFLVFHPYWSQAVLGFLDGADLIADTYYLSAYEENQILNAVSAVFLVIAFLTFVIAVLYQLYAKEEET